MMSYLNLIAELLGGETPKEQYENLQKLIEENNKLKLKFCFSDELLEDGEHYRINGKKQILCWQDNQWMKPEKDHQKKFGSWNSVLAQQPIVKSAEKVQLKDLYA